ncbi:uncharacterized protein LOC144581638 [Callithrix jacchus]
MIATTTKEAEEAEGKEEAEAEAEAEEEESVNLHTAADWILGSKFGCEIFSRGARRVHDGSDRVSERLSEDAPRIRRARTRRLAPAPVSPRFSLPDFSPVLRDPVSRGGPR